MKRYLFLILICLLAGCATEAEVRNQSTASSEVTVADTASPALDANIPSSTETSTETRERMPRTVNDKVRISDSVDLSPVFTVPSWVGIDVSDHSRQWRAQWQSLMPDAEPTDERQEGNTNELVFHTGSQFLNIMSNQTGFYGVDYVNHQENYTYAILLNNLTLNHEAQRLDYQADKDLPFASQSDTKQQVEHYLVEKLGLQQADIEIAAVNRQDLVKLGAIESQMEQAKEGNLPDYQAIPEFYAVSVYPTLSGQRVLSQQLIAEGTSEENWMIGTQIQLYVTASGIDEVLIGGYRYLNAEQGNQTTFDMQSVVAALQSRYRDVILEEAITVTRIDLEYVPVREGSQQVYKPAWRIRFDQQPDLFLDAQTGQEVSHHD